MLSTPYRGPIVAAVLLVLASVILVGLDWQQNLEVEVQGTRRHADSLVMSLGVLADDVDFDDPGARSDFATLVSQRLQLHPPLRFAGVECRGERTAAVGDPNAMRQDGDEARFEVRRPLAAPPSARPPGGHRGAPPRAKLPPPREPPPGAGGDVVNRPQHHPPVPWSWRPGVGASPQCEVVVVLDAHAPWEAREHLMATALTKLGLAWLAIFGLTFAWVRTIRARVLVAALDAERRENDRLAELGLAASGLAHETKNPLGIVRGLAQRLARESVSSDQRAELAETIMDEVDRASARLSDFMNFARPSPLHLAAIDVGDLVRRLAKTFAADLEERGIAVDVDVTLPPIAADESKLEQILVNLILNSIAACDEGGRLRIVGNVQHGVYVLVVEDNGSGIPAAMLADVTKPYVSGRSMGHGLGLAIVHRLVSQHGWHLEIDSIPGAGTSVRIVQLQPADGGRA